MGDQTRATPNLYPHQWSLDSAFIALGLAHLSTRRAASELLALFEHQWGTGKISHIVFNPEAPLGSYFPGSDHWACAAASPDVPPEPPHTSYCGEETRRTHDHGLMVHLCCAEDVHPRGAYQYFTIPLGEDIGV